MAARTEWHIVVVDAIPKRWPSTAALVATGVPVATAARWAKERREMSARGLKRRVKAWVN